MENLSVLTAGVTAVILFVFGLDHFSTEIERISGERFRRFLGKATNLPIVGVMLGAIVTAVIQSSSATSVITISLVNAGVLSFRSSVGIIFGSNIGTTLTAQLVAFKLTSFAPVLIIIGFALSLARTRISIFGKSIFYFGFVFFTLELISSSLSPLQQNPDFTAFLTHQSPLMALFIGCVFTALVQSSSVTTALAIIFTQQGLITLDTAIPLIMGSNIGTTATAFIAVFTMDAAAKKTALAHFFFNVGGVIVFAPAFIIFSSQIAAIDMNPAILLANVHLTFNVATTLLFLVFIGPFTRFIDRLLGEGKMDFERIKLPTWEVTKPFDEVKQQLEQNIEELLAFLQENYNLVTLSIESNYRGVFDASTKRIEYIEFLEKEYMAYFSRVVGALEAERESEAFLALTTRFDYLFQIHDSIIDLFSTKKLIDESYIDIRSDILLLIRGISSHTLMLFEDIRHTTNGSDRPAGHSSRELYGLLESANRDLLRLMAKPDRPDASLLISFITYSRRLRDKLVNLQALRG